MPNDVACQLQSTLGILGFRISAKIERAEYVVKQSCWPRYILLNFAVVHIRRIEGVPPLCIISQLCRAIKELQSIEEILFKDQSFNRLSSQQAYDSVVWRLLMATSCHQKSDNLQYHILGRCVTGKNDSSTKHLMFQVLFFS